MKTLVCTSCGTSTHRPVTITKGNLGTEIVLWLMFLLPGFLYSVWRHTTRTTACPACHSADLIPAESPRGRKLVAEHGVVEAETHGAARAIGRMVGKMTRRGAS